MFLHVVVPVVLLVAGALAISGLSPAGINQDTWIRLGWYMASVTSLFYMMWKKGRRPRPDFGAFLDSVPRWVWVAFAGGHGVVFGTVLAMAWEAPFTPMMLGFGAVAASAGAFIPTLRRVQ